MQAFGLNASHLLVIQTSSRLTKPSLKISVNALPTSSWFCMTAADSETPGVPWLG